MPYPVALIQAEYENPGDCPYDDYGRPVRVPFWMNNFPPGIIRLVLADDVQVHKIMWDYLFGEVNLPF